MGETTVVIVAFVDADDETEAEAVLLAGTALMSAAGAEIHTAMTFPGRGAGERINRGIGGPGWGSGEKAL